MKVSYSGDPCDGSRTSPFPHAQTLAARRSIPPLPTRSVTRSGVQHQTISLTCRHPEALSNQASLASQGSQTREAARERLPPHLQLHSLLSRGESAGLSEGAPDTPYSTDESADLDSQVPHPFLPCLPLLLVGLACQGDTPKLHVKAYIANIRWV